MVDVDWAGATVHLKYVEIQAEEETFYFSH